MCCLKSSLTSGSLIVLTLFSSSFPHIPASSMYCCAGVAVLLGSGHFDRRFSITRMRLSSVSNLNFSACVGSLKAFIGFSFSMPFRSFLAFFFGLSETIGVSFGVKARSSAEYYPTFANTISAASFSSCPSFLGVVSLTTCGVSSGACCGVSAVASDLADLAIVFVGSSWFWHISFFWLQLLKSMVSLQEDCC